MITQALNSTKSRQTSEALNKAKSELDQIFEDFKKCPTTKNGGVLGRAMNSYGRAFAEAERNGGARS